MRRGCPKAAVRAGARIQQISEIPRGVSSEGIGPRHYRGELDDGLLLHGLFARRFAGCCPPRDEIHRQFLVRGFWMRTTPNQPDAVNPAIAPRFQTGYQWRGVTDPTSEGS